MEVGLEREVGECDDPEEGKKKQADENEGQGATGAGGSATVRPASSSKTAATTTHNEANTPIATIMRER